jgi:hypothetical protein
MADFDHVSADGNRKFIDWALDGDLHWMIDAGRQPGGDGTAR